MTDPREVQGLMVEQERPKSNAGVRLTPLGQEPALPGVPNTSVIHVQWLPPFDYGVPITSYDLLVDGASLGGSGQSFDHRALERLDDSIQTPVLLAGGLTRATACTA